MHANGFDRREIERLKAHPLFDAEWYARRYPDVALSGIDPAVHYMNYGHRMLRDPGPGFSTWFARQAMGVPDHLEPLAAMQRGLAKADKARVLRAAAEIAERSPDRSHSDLAIALAEAHLPRRLRHTVHLLRANAAIGWGIPVPSADQAWLACVNDYLAAQGVAPIALAPHEGGAAQPMVARLRPGAPVRPVTGGPLVSVLMPCWNAGALVEMAARSILGQSWRNLELIVVDDCSTDDSWDVLRRLADSDPRVRILRNTVNLGPYICKNIAVTQASGSYITGHDADDWAHPERIERQVRFCMEGDRPACLSGMLRVDPAGRFVRFNDIGGNVHDGACRSAFISLMVQAQVFHGGFGFWDEVRVAGDSELIHRMQHIFGEPIPHLPVTTMFCLDSPQGLTNNAALGHSERGGVALPRAEYKKSFQRYHRTLDKLSARRDFPETMRRFRAPPELLDSVQKIAAGVQDHVSRGLMLRRRVETDVAIVTNLRFPGGNASSTLDEIRVMRAHGLRVTLVHSPVTRDIARTISDRYLPWADLILDWPRLESLSAHCLIVRHPAVVVADPFRRIVDRLQARHAFVVINNSHLRANGRPVYDIGAMVGVARRIAAPGLQFCPISPLMRAELVDYAARTGDALSLPAQDWTPTLDPADYLLEPKARFGSPVTIGRHGRDGTEKWHENRDVLLSVYGDRPDRSIVILGGAAQVERRLGALPANWTVHGFGTIAPRDYLAGLDVFVYYPQSTLVEGFGRTVAEAMMAGVPCILPFSLERTFGELAFYAEPGGVHPLIDRLRADDAGRIAFLKEVQSIALARFSSGVIRARLSETGLFPEGEAGPAEGLSPQARAWRQRILDAGFPANRG